MFPRSSFIMLLIAALMLVTASVINHLIDKPVNLWYLGFGLILLIYSTAMLLFKKK